jgi:hypothetical protein
MMNAFPLADCAEEAVTQGLVKRMMCQVVSYRLYTVV